MTILSVILLFILCWGVNFLISAGLVWLVCWGLNAIGIMAIGPVAVTFSWPLALIVFIITTALGGLFKVTVNTSK